MADEVFSIKGIAFDEDICNLKLPDPNLITFYNNLKERVLWLNMDVDESIISFGQYIIRWNMEDKGIPVENRKPIKIMIFQHGGDIDFCNHLVDIMLASVTPVYTYNMGIAMQAALSILLAGSKRYCLKKSTALIHSGSGQIAGTTQQVISFSELYQKNLDDMFNYIASRTNINIKTLNKRKKDEWFLNADEQVKLGVVDKIIESLDEII